MSDKKKGLFERLDEMANGDYRLPESPFDVYTPQELGIYPRNRQYDE